MTRWPTADQLPGENMLTVLTTCITAATICTLGHQRAPHTNAALKLLNRSLTVHDTLQDDGKEKRRHKTATTLLLS